MSAHTHTYEAHTHTYAYAHTHRHTQNTPLPTYPPTHPPTTHTPAHPPTHPHTTHTVIVKKLTCASARLEWSLDLLGRHINIVIIIIINTHPCPLTHLHTQLPSHSLSRVWRYSFSLPPTQNTTPCPPTHPPTHPPAHPLTHPHTTHPATFAQLEQGLEVLLLGGAGLVHPGQHVPGVAQRVVGVQLDGAGGAPGACNTHRTPSTNHHHLDLDLDFYVAGTTPGFKMRRTGGA